jgi:hypothetical protein
MALSTILIASFGVFVLGATAPVWAIGRDAGVAQAPPRPPMPPFKFMIDAHVCPVPETGLFEPDGFTDFQLAVRDALLPNDGTETVLQVVVQPSFEPPYSISLVRRRAEKATDKNLQLRLVRAKTNLWGEMMQEMAREQGNVIHLDPQHQRSALAKVAHAVETTTIATTGELANQLRAVWEGVLARTQYVHEVLVAPDGSSRIYHTADGTTYSFWNNGRSGTTHSPPAGSLLGDFVAIADDLRQLVAGAPPQRAAREQQLKGALSRLTLRIETNEPCVRPDP